MADKLKPTRKMAANARQGLELRERFGRGGTEVGVRRAEQLIAGGPISFADVKAMYSYFARHEVDKQSKSHIWGNDDNPSAGYIAWLLWGGDEGREWAIREREKMRE